MVWGMLSVPVFFRRVFVGGDPLRDGVSMGVKMHVDAAKEAWQDAWWQCGKAQAQGWGKEVERGCTGS
jgi:hypothetical protein